VSAAPAAEIERFRAMHRGATPFVMPNAFDIGSAKVLAALDFDALATTSSGFAATLGRGDGYVTRDEALAHAAAMSAAVDVPVSADFENCFAHEPADVAETVRLAIDTGLSGCSVEDYAGRDRDEIYDAGLAAERVAAAVDAAAGRLVITARAENYLHGRPDFGDTVARLQSFQAAGADVLFAPGVNAPHDISALVHAVDRPVNVVAVPCARPVTELGALGVKRVSVGGALMWIALAAVAEAARGLREDGEYATWDTVGQGRDIARLAFD